MLYCIYFITIIIFNKKKVDPFLSKKYIKILFLILYFKFKNKFEKNSFTLLNLISNVNDLGVNCRRIVRQNETLRMM